MTTELERLKAWMEKTGNTPQRLAWATCVSTGRIERILNGDYPMGERMKFTFGLKFGREALVSIFDFENPPVNHRDHRDWYPERQAARRALSTAVRQGVLRPAKTHKCQACPEQAKHYHHPSYHSNDHLCVVPLCGSCHMKVHRAAMPLHLGLVPTFTGLIRIAIAGL